MSVLTLKDFINDYNRLVVRIPSPLLRSAEVHHLIATYYLHIQQDCYRWLDW